MIGILLGTVLVLALVPFLQVRLPLLLPGPISSPGSLQILAVALIFAGVAVAFDVLFGYVGLLSAGHALFFGLGIYATNLAMIRLGLPFPLAAALAVTIATVAAVAVGALALRAKHLAFTMVTLAFAEAFWIFLRNDPLRITGGDDGLPLAFDRVPALLAGVQNTRSVFWLASVFFVVVCAIGYATTRSLCGHVWEAIRENEERVEMLGLVPYTFKLVAFTISCSLPAAGGAIFLLAARSASPASASVEFSLALIVMVVIGGAGRLWGAALGGAGYALLTLRLPALAESGAFDGLPAWAAKTLAEPVFILGVVFVLFVLFLPTGIAGVLGTAARRRPRRTTPTSLTDS